MIEPGEVWYADVPSAGPRPVIVVSRESLNRGKYVVAVPCTTTKLTLRSQLPNCVFFHSGSFGFTRDCVAQCEAISVLPISLFLSQIPAGKLDDASLRKVINAIGYVIDSICDLN